MPTILTIGLFLLVLFALGLLVKWEFRRLRRYGTPFSLSRGPKLEPPRTHIAYVPPPERSQRAFSVKTGRN